MSVNSDLNIHEHKKEELVGGPNSSALQLNNSSASRHYLLSRITILAGLALWMSIAVINNSTDSNTNSVYITQMLSMILIRNDPSSGAGLLWRAINIEWAGFALLCFVILIQFIVAIMLWRAAILHMLAGFGRSIDVQKLMKSAILALTAFICIWLFLMVGGFWFGYWLHMGAFQQVHMTLLIIGIISKIYMVATEPFLKIE